MIRNLSNGHEYLVYKFSRQKEPFCEFRLRNHNSVKEPEQIQHEFEESIFEQIYFRKLPSCIFSMESPTVLDTGANVGCSYLVYRL